MRTRHVARLQFRANGPVSEGEWTVPDTALARYTEWTGLYGSDLDVVICLIEETDGRERVRKTWKRGREVKGWSDPFDKVLPTEESRVDRGTGKA